jgi:hypothetical protein
MMKRIKTKTALKVGLILLLGSGLSLGYSSRAQAITFDYGTGTMGDLLGQLISPLEQQFSLVETLLQDQIGSEQWSSLLGNLLGSNETNLSAMIWGDLGLPDLRHLHSQIKTELESQEKTTLSAYQGVRSSHELDRLLTTTRVEASLSQEGQEIAQQKIEGAVHNAQTAHSLSDEAQTVVSTQEVMKKLAQQQAIQASLMAGVNTSLVELQQSQEFNNLNLSNISRTLDGQAQTQQLERLGAGNDALRRSAMTRLY